jgi:NADH-quinone oxidoreductase subunit L
VLKPTAATFLTTEQNQLVLEALLVLVLPLVAGLGLLLISKKLSRNANWLALAATSVSLLLAIYIFIQVWEKQVVQAVYPWFSFPREGTPFSFTVGVYLDNLAVLMLVLVTFISLLVQVSQLFTCTPTGGITIILLTWAYLPSACWELF